MVFFFFPMDWNVNRDRIQCPKIVSSTNRLVVRHWIVVKHCMMQRSDDTNDQDERVLQLIVLVVESIDQVQHVETSRDFRHVWNHGCVQAEIKQNEEDMDWKEEL